MNLLEALKQISEHTDDKQHFMPADKGNAGNFPIGYFGHGQPTTLFSEMYNQTRDAQMGPGHKNQLRYNPDAVERFLAEQPVSKNIDDRRGEIQPIDEPYSINIPEDLQFDPNDPLAKLLGINSIRPPSMAFDPVPLPRPRPRR